MDVCYARGVRKRLIERVCCPLVPAASMLRHSSSSLLSPVAQALNMREYTAEDLRKLVAGGLQEKELRPYLACLPTVAVPMLGYGVEAVSLGSGCSGGAMLGECGNGGPAVRGGSLLPPCTGSHHTPLTPTTCKHPPIAFHRPPAHAGKGEGGTLLVIKLFSTNGMELPPAHFQAACEADSLLQLQAHPFALKMVGVCQHPPAILLEHVDGPTLEAILT